MEENIITSILEIDQKAKEKLTEAEKEKNRILADAKAEQERIINNKLKKADDELKKREEDEKSKASDELSRIEFEKDVEVRRLEKLYAKKHTEWEDEIFKAIIG